MTKIPLTQGYVAVVDDDDGYLASFKWSSRIDKSGTVYAHRQVVEGGKKTTVLLHREVLKLKRGDPLVDHKDGDGLNCQKANLRISNRSQNALNKSEPRADNKGSPYRGVTRSTSGRFVARFKINGKVKHLGTFDTPEAALKARLLAEKEHGTIEPRRKHLHE